MTAVRLYGLIWLFVLAAAGVSYAAGLINAMTLPILGFLISTLAFMGFVAVLPVWLNDHFSPKTHPAAFGHRAPKFRPLHQTSSKEPRHDGTKLGRNEE